MAPVVLVGSAADMFALVADTVGSAAGMGLATAAGMDAVCVGRLLWAGAWVRVRSTAAGLLWAVGSMAAAVAGRLLWIAGSGELNGSPLLFAGVTSSCPCWRIPVPGMAL